MTDNTPLMTAADCARQIGITVRALRVYEERGLLSPPRTEKNWRLYGAREVARLSEILTFKAMGFNLNQITELLSGQESATDAVLALQQSRLTEHRQRIDRSLGLVIALRDKTARGEDLPVSDLVNLAKEMQMTDIPTNDVAWKRYEQMRPRVEIETDPAQLSDYVGYFRLADDTAAEITVEDAKIYLRMSGQFRVQMFAEAKDSLFFKAVAAQVTFERTDGKVTGFTLHQHGVEQFAGRTDKASFDRAEAELKAGAARTEARPQSQETLREFIAALRAGTPDYDAMTPLLAQLVRDQHSLLIDGLDRLGAIKHIDFRKVDNRGYDVFDVCFENGVLEYGISERTYGRLDGLYMRRSTNDSRTQKEAS